MSIEQQIAALETMSSNELVDEYTTLHGRPPRCRYRRWLEKRVAWKLQERAYGGLSMAAKRRLEELISELHLPIHDEEKPRHSAKNGGLTPASTISRTWRGREIRVLVTEHGFEHDGQLFKSLSAVARQVTGTRWSGPLFFGLSKTRIRS